MEATKRFIDAGSVSTALTPAKPFVPTDTPPQFTVAGVEVAHGGDACGSRL